MSKKKRRGRNKNKKRKAKRDNRPSRPAALAYHGNKYRTEELAPSWFHTEIGIYESFLMTDRQLTDRQVRCAVQTLISRIRRGTLTDLDDGECVEYEERSMEEFVIWNVRQSWENLFQMEPRPGRDKLVGVLRTILGLIEDRRLIGPTSRAYLKYIGEFLKNAGVSFEMSPADSQATSMADWDAGRSWD